ncbi:hypothetical protein PR202_ga09320 [Eleusine coracana subsp. coracana]|uniref:Glycosyltransferase n=1 Tax=Eleusine coracana subsp. coracana TaxID=191504 RepID=A0AAV5C3G5_ELECO|nr:hypothetical protein PR202_ga09320 [Eleusine coracana subsp. coracana]
MDLLSRLPFLVLRLRQTSLLRLRSVARLRNQMEEFVIAALPNLPAAPSGLGFCLGIGDVFLVSSDEEVRTNESHTTPLHRDTESERHGNGRRGAAAHCGGAVPGPWPRERHDEPVPPPRRARGAEVTFVVTEEWRGLFLALLPRRAAGRASACAPSPTSSPPSTAAPPTTRASSTPSPPRWRRPSSACLTASAARRPRRSWPTPTYLPWVVGVGNRRGVQVWSLFPMSASFFSAYCHFDLLPPWLTGEPATQPGEAEGSHQKLGHYISNLSSSSIRLSDLEPLIHNKRTVKHVLAAVSSIRNAQCLLFTTMYELEASVIDSLRSRLSCPVYPIGPCVPYMTLEDHRNMPNGKVTSQADYFTWLDTQPVNSVLYVSLGSFLSTSASQLEEIALGLASSEVRFLWIIREQSPQMRQLIGDTDKGMILPWCEQLKVLCHPSVGGFLTHCGMNSTLEAVFAGVPMLALPLFFDQPIDCRLIMEDWKIGLNLKDWTNKDGLIGRDNIAQAVKRLMRSDEAEAKALRRRALELKEASRKTVNKGGFSYCNLSSLMEMARKSR